MLDHPLNWLVSIALDLGFADRLAELAMKTASAVGPILLGFALGLLPALGHSLVIEQRRRRRLTRVLSSELRVLILRLSEVAKLLEETSVPQRWLERSLSFKTSWASVSPADLSLLHDPALGYVIQLKASLQQLEVQYRGIEQYVTETGELFPKEYAIKHFETLKSALLSETDSVIRVAQLSLRAIEGAA